VLLSQLEVLLAHQHLILQQYVLLIASLTSDVETTTQVIFSDSSVAEKIVGPVQGPCKIYSERHDLQKI
jgi:hypothetical protein